MLPAGDGREHAVAVVGDLNDEVQAATTQILLGPPGSEICTPGFRTADKADAGRLWNVAPLIPAEQRFSRVNSGRRELIDHVLCSHRLVHRVTAAGTGLPGAGSPELPSVGAAPQEGRGRIMRRSGTPRPATGGWRSAAAGEPRSPCSANG